MSKKYCVLDLVKKLKSLKYSSWYLASEWEQHNYNEYKLIELNVDKGECTLSIREYNRSIGETLYFLVIPEYFLKDERIYLSSSRSYLIKVARKYSWFSEDDIFSFVYEGTDIRHFV